MSSKIYFNTKGGVNVRRRAINVATRAYHRIAPSHARKTARNLLLTPERFSAKAQAPEGLQKKAIETSEGKIMTYSLGSGPTWLLGHGWSGSASQFYTLMERIAASGFTALAFDNPAHGASDGQHGHLPGFVKGLEAVLEQEVDELAGVVAHSMGCTMVLESKHAKLAGVPMLLVAPILNYKDNLYRVVEGSGFSLRLFQDVIREVEHQYQYPIDSVDSHQRLAGHQGHIVIVHDNSDRFALFEQSRKANALPRVSLIETSGLGHNRILKSEPLLRAFDDLSKNQTTETH
ncbi:alpha/beta hydrolase [Photobacterium sp. 2_MG-2023]|uniref:Alpha/beta hydrolase n=1 Tax=Photobacterium arenosum TaxID=2774143 RepID=A0ABR9BRP1_9GAMM|nr:MULTISPECIES: alpha/beta hydrolase [Photobacterium]MBD8514237.1 alpha/beta hydrolase [Photobacterium arenosum]MDO6581442.1 alpha/beta hydrolase [Photobacterium sp. 2_MG-2023]